MTQAVKGRTAKAWKLVKDSLEDDDAYHKLRNGFPIQITGSSGTLFILYPSGRFVKVGLESPQIGKMVKGSYYASPDYLATIISWIRFDEEQLEKNWECGNFHMHEPVRERVGERQIFDYGGRRNDHDWVLPIAMVCATASLIIFLPYILDFFQTGLIATPVEGAEAGGITDFTDIFSNILPLILPIAMIMMMFSIMKKLFDH